MCFSEPSNCKLICNHSFCKGCVKTWYIKSKVEPTCPNCRHPLYFKGLYKMKKIWEEESEKASTEEVFSEAFDIIVCTNEADFEFESESEDGGESESDADSDISESSWDTQEPPEPSTEHRFFLDDDSEDGDFISENQDSIIEDLKNLQKRYHKMVSAGASADYMEAFLLDEWFWIRGGIQTVTTYNEDEEFPQKFPHYKNMFISKYPGTINKKRTSKRIMERLVPSSFITVLFLFC